MRGRIIIVSIIVVAGMAIAGFINQYYQSDDYHNPDNRLKVYNPSDVNPELVDPELWDKSKDHTIADFSFVNQLGDTITQKDTEGKIYVADYFFTTCGGICPKLTKSLQRVQTEFKSDPNLLILSHTVNPSYDTVEVLYAYAEKFKANHEKWWFLTGAKKDLYVMARKSYLIVPDEADSNYQHGGDSDFIHSENFALIDPDKRIRGLYDGTNSDEVSKLIQDIYDLKREYDLP